MDNEAQARVRRRLYLERKLRRPARAVPRLVLRHEIIHCGMADCERPLYVVTAGDALQPIGPNVEPDPLAARDGGVRFWCPACQQTFRPHDIRAALERCP